MVYHAQGRQTEAEPELNRAQAIDRDSWAYTYLFLSAVLKVVGRAGQAGGAALREPVVEAQSAALRAPRNCDLVAPSKREQQEPSVLERDECGRMQLPIILVATADQVAGLERAHTKARLDALGGCAQQTV